MSHLLFLVGFNIFCGLDGLKCDFFQADVKSLLEIVYTGSIEATMEEMRRMLILAHSLYISVPVIMMMMVVMIVMMTVKTVVISMAVMLEVILIYRFALFDFYVYDVDDDDYIDKNSNDNHDLKGERPADEDAGVDVAAVALLEAEVSGTCSSQRQSGRCSTIPR